MIRILPFILIPILIIGVLSYWRYSASNTNETVLKTQKVEPIEVPKTLPQASLEDRVKSLEDLVIKVVTQLNNLKSQPTSQTQSTTTDSTDSKSTDLESQVTELKARVSSLEKATPAPVTTTFSKATVYIPLGSGGGPWGDTSWLSLNEYQVSINPSDYPDYSSMQLEANIRIVEPVGTGSVRLYNITDGTSISSQIDTTSTSFGVQTSGTFKLSGGKKTYTIQAQTTQGRNLFIQNARIKVNF